MRKPNKKPIPKKIMIRKVNMSELSKADQELLRKGLAQSAAGQVSPLPNVKNMRGMKVITATKQVMDVFQGLPEGDVQQILQHIVNDAAAQKRRKNTKSKMKYDIDVMTGVGVNKDAGPKPKACKTCWGYGLHMDGTAPMGPIDAGDGMPTSACPECKRNPNPVRGK
jgi:hypothetical protein